MDNTVSYSSFINEKCPVHKPEFMCKNETYFIVFVLYYNLTNPNIFTCIDPNYWTMLILFSWLQMQLFFSSVWNPFHWPNLRLPIEENMCIYANVHLVMNDLRNSPTIKIIDLKQKLR